MVEINTDKCSRCHKKFDDIIVAIKLDINVFRLNAMDYPEEIANLDQESHEYLCKDCFDKFSYALESMNLEEQQRDELRDSKTNNNSQDAQPAPEKQTVPETQRREHIPMNNSPESKYIDDVQYD